MKTKTKSALMTAAALLMTAGTSFAAPAKYHHNHRDGVTPYERAQIARSAATLANLKKRAWRDGKITLIERFQINNAERRHAALVARARRT